MTFLTVRAGIIGTFLSERRRYGMPRLSGPMDQEVLFILDGVGGFQVAVLLVRRALRLEGISMGSVLHRWQFGLTGEIWTDLMWLRRNRLMGLKLARELLTFRREHPETVVHLLAYSGGAGVAVFACEALRGRVGIETLVLACPALSPTYNLGQALGAVTRCYALISRRDRVILGLGTRIFGTTDRRFVAAAGQAGFRLPPGLSDADAEGYARLRQIHWTPELKRLCHFGGHVGYSAMPWLRRHLMPILRGTPELPIFEAKPA